MPTSLLWFRRDLRLSDHPALLAAIDAAGPDGDVLPAFVFDPHLWEPAGAPGGASSSTAWPTCTRPPGAP